MTRVAVLLLKLCAQKRAMMRMMPCNIKMQERLGFASCSSLPVILTREHENKGPGSSTGSD